MKGTVEYNVRPPRPAWGIRPLPRKTISLAQPIRNLPPPSRVVIPINQCLGMAARPFVTAGQNVLTGQPIAGAVSPSANQPGPQVHASISGVVTAIESRAIAGRDGTDHQCVIIDSDGKDHPYPGFDELGEPMSMAPEAICQHIANAGIVGLGGALYSTATKLLTDQPIDTLILNGAECEPYITCDEILMRDHAANILRGTQIMMRALGTPLAIVAVESDMPEARVALYDAIEADDCDNIHVAVVTAKYPAGGERQLIELIMNREVPESGLPADIGIVCHNVGTAAAITDLFDRHRPLISRIVTVTGRGIQTPGNLEVRIGTPVHELFAICGGLHANVSHLIMGGPMMGITLPDDSLPVTKATNCVIVMQAADVSPVQTEMPCIRCGECLQVCPSRLLPQELLTATRQHDMDALQEFGLTACIECGCCDYVCPSQIQLTRRFIIAKAALGQHRIDKRRAEHAKQRYTAREARLTEQRETEAAALEQQAVAANTDSIEMIMERARDKEQSE
jgi:electron transport complex protein RnfC